MGNQHIYLYDTTLRDGNQAVGISLSLNDKLRIAEKLDALGIHYIEGGWPTRDNAVDTAFFREVRSLSLSSRIAVFGSTRRADVTCGKDPLLRKMVGSGAPVATIFGKSWDLHVKKILRIPLSRNLDIIAETVSYLKRHFDEVLFDAEHFFDGFRENPAYAIHSIVAAQQAGADGIVLCDTNGGMLPMDIPPVIRKVRECIPGMLGIHTHNDAGCADANSFMAIDCGIRHVQGTINGLGERSGNANLCTLIPGLQLKMGLNALPDSTLKQLTATSVFVSEIANVTHDIRLPYVGESAFSHKAGTHADGVSKESRSFEHIEPALVGNTRRFVVSDQAGSSTIFEKLRTVIPAIEKKSPEVKAILSCILAMEADGYQFEAADGSFELIAREQLHFFEEPFVFKGFRVIEEKRENGEVFSEATIKVEDNGKLEHTAAEGDGPVNALDNALRKALVQFYPSLREVHLEDFKVRVLDGKFGTAAKVRVLIESSDGKDRWGTVGVSSNVIEASWLALIDSLKYKLMKDTIETSGD